MANKKYHHLFPRNGVYYFRKAGHIFSLETRVGTEAIKMRDRLLERYRIYGDFKAFPEHDDELTFGKFAKEWAKKRMGKKKKIKPSTWRDYSSSLNKHVLPAFKDVPIKDIKAHEVKDFRDNLECKAKRANNILVPMRAIFSFALGKEYISTNIMDQVGNLEVEQPDIFPFTVEEVEVILDAIDPFYEPYTCCRFYTGMRDGEINALRWSDYKEKMPTGPKLNVNKSFVYGEEGPPKTQKSRRPVDCLEFVVEALEKQKELTGNSEYIFLTKDGSRMNPDHFREVVWKPALKKAGLNYRPPIQTRHTFATMMLPEGRDAIGWVKKCSVIRLYR